MTARRVAAQIDAASPRLTVIHNGCEVDMLVVTRRRTAELYAFTCQKRLSRIHRKMLLSPMPGLLVSLAVEAGQSVKGRRAIGGCRGDEDGEHLEG